jgi:hypothetical protein
MAWMMCVWLLYAALPKLGLEITLGLFHSNCDGAASGQATGGSASAQGTVFKRALCALGIYLVPANSNIVHDVLMIDQLVPVAFDNWSSACGTLA